MHYHASISALGGSHIVSGTITYYADTEAQAEAFAHEAALRQWPTARGYRDHSAVVSRVEAGNTTISAVARG